ncbi:hypothetical protein CDAR_268591 [Caerostris darwini]|uniref:Uncharacterized protein n=1 Tax=Caerostris darwini TaxID=1538125 RepID=A0AAV4X4Y6_9ARAC|nr:hypothetical protein CDAR_268591 [Caerostris darwini]
MTPCRSQLTQTTAHLCWAREHVTRNRQQGASVLFTNKSEFLLERDSDRVLIWIEQANNLILMKDLLHKDSYSLNLYEKRTSLPLHHPISDQKKHETSSQTTLPLPPRSFPAVTSPPSTWCVGSSVPVFTSESPDRRGCGAILLFPGERLSDSSSSLPKGRVVKRSFLLVVSKKCNWFYFSKCWKWMLMRLPSWWMVLIK